MRLHENVSISYTFLCIVWEINGDLYVRYLYPGVTCDGLNSSNLQM